MSAGNFHGWVRIWGDRVIPVGDSRRVAGWAVGRVASSFYLKVSGWSHARNQAEAKRGGIKDVVGDAVAIDETARRPAELAPAGSLP